MKKIHTKAIHSGEKIDKFTGAIIPPIHLSTIFAQKEPGKHRGFEYGRVDNPTRKILEKKIAELESGKFALVFSSGQAAGAAVLSLLQSGDHVLCSRDCYEGTLRLLKIFEKLGLQCDFIDMTDLRKINNSIKNNTKLIWFETPTNPLLKIIDINMVSKIAKRKKVKILVDNTLATPIFQRPLEFGADFVLSSVSKFLAGHNDVIGGALVVNDKKLFEQLKFLQHTLGSVLSPFDCFLVLRGLKTLPIRMERHFKNAFLIAKFLRSHKKIEKVAFPWLPQHPGYTIAKKQMKGCGGVVSFWVKNGLKGTIKFLKSLKLIKIAQSFGGPESVIQHPITMMKLTLSKKEREELGLTENFVRLSVGLEDVEDLIADLKQALEK